MQSQVTNLDNELNATRNEFLFIQDTLHSIRSGSTSKVKPKNPESSKGNGSIRSWIEELSDYIADTLGSQDLAVGTSYLNKPADN